MWIGWGEKELAAEIASWKVVSEEFGEEREDESRESGGMVGQWTNRRSICSRR